MCGGCGTQNDRRRSTLSPCCQSQQERANPCSKEYEKQGPPVEDRKVCIGDYEKHMYEQHEEDICDHGPREPYHIPGYAAHVPSLQSRSGGTFGSDSHKVLISNRKQKPIANGMTGHICPTPVHEPYRLPGYTGHVPGLMNMVGGTYGQDTHKLLYSIQSYPNRQVNLSPYRPTQGVNAVGDGSDTKETLEQNQNTHHLPHKTGEAGHFATTHETYNRPKEHYYQPQYKYRIADTYATTADLTLVDPCINQESKVVVSTRELDDTQVVRTQSTLEERVQDSPYINKPLRHRPMVPGFDAFVDAMRGARGQRYEFTHQSPEHTRFQQQLILQKGRIREPLKRGQTLAGQGKDLPLGQQSANDIPYGYGRYGERQKYTNSTLCDFASNYRRRQSSEWAPANISRPDPPAFDVPGEIYTQHMGLLPGYSAHVPGALFRCGKTFTDDSRDARKALRGDRF